MRLIHGGNAPRAVITRAQDYSLAQQRARTLAEALDVGRDQPKRPALRLVNGVSTNDDEHDDTSDHHDAA